MRIVKPSYEVFEFLTEEEPLQKVEICGRTCYQSADKITEDSRFDFAKKLQASKHLSVFEHASIAVGCTNKAYREIQYMPTKNKRFFTFSDFENRNIVTGNLRAWIELFDTNAFYSLRFFKNALANKIPQVFGVYRDTSFNSEEAAFLNFRDLTPKELKVHYRPTVRFIADRGFLAEIRTHRDASFSAESTRYCSYNGEKFGSEITVVEPLFFSDTNSQLRKSWEAACQYAETAYFTLLSTRSPQEARTVLPQSLKSEIVCTANFGEWEHIFSLRAVSGAHPQMIELMKPLQDEFKERYKEVLN